jgi:hypothetical protein
VEADVFFFVCLAHLVSTARLGNGDCEAVACKSKVKKVKLSL